MNRNSAQSVALLAGAALIAIGLLGFLPGTTTQYDSISFAGEGSGAKLVGLFQVSILLNLVQLLIGAAGIWLAKTTSGARQYLLGAGVAYLVLWALGIAQAGKWIPVNAADHWLHLGFGAGLIGLAFATSGSLRSQAA
ncbi:MAG TPA: DUF4383 domain-containing protein [Gaiellaceae bacterium]|nr:DUF4383 domain-containing protein [Gaiellaceae bacterium]